MCSDNTMLVKQDTINEAVNKKISYKFNSELEEDLSKIEIVSDYYNKNPERLRDNPTNKKAVSDFCNLYFGLRTKFKDKYGFDFGYLRQERIKKDEYGKNETNKDGSIIYEYFIPIKESNGIEVSLEVLAKDTDMNGKVVEARNKIGERN